MNLLAEATEAWTVRSKSDEAITEFTERVMSLTRPVLNDDRRHDKRFPFPQLLTLTPIDDSVIEVSGDSVTVAGKHLAGRGIDFFHSFPLTFKRAIVSFDGDCFDLDAHFVLNISWCRFLRPGWYDSGGRFTHILSRG